MKRLNLLLIFASLLPSGSVFAGPAVFTLTFETSTKGSMSCQANDGTFQAVVNTNSSSTVSAMNVPQQADNFGASRATMFISSGDRDQVHDSFGVDELLLDVHVQNRGTTLGFFKSGRSKLFYHVGPDSGGEVIHGELTVSGSLSTGVAIRGSANGVFNFVANCVGNGVVIVAYTIEVAY